MAEFKRAIESDPSTDVVPHHFHMDSNTSTVQVTEVAATGHNRPIEAEIPLVNKTDGPK